MTDPLQALAPSGLALPDALVAGLRAAYAGPGRVYHGEAHVEDVARQFAEAGRGEPWSRPHEVYLAVLWHDAVYEPGAKDNEARSARLARATVLRWLPHAGLDLGRVEQLILWTARHGSLTPADVDGEAARFLDCDMAILAAPPDAFDAYDRAIAAEYAALPRELYAAGRRAFLARLLASERIFLSPDFHVRLDAAARANLARALSG